MTSPFTLETTAPDCGARAGRVQLAHGEVCTPVFMPVGTKATVKGLTPEMIKGCGAQIVLANTYHMHLRPGSEIVRDLGGLNTFSGIELPFLTDSGGFQVFSLGDMNTITDDGVEFKSHLDGSKHFFSPEKSIEIQNNLGADIIMAFDECPPYPCEDSYLKKSLARTHAWAARCKAAHKRPHDQLLFGIVQGGIDPELRRQSVEAIEALDFPGNAVGGVSVGEGPELMRAVVEMTVPLMNPSKPRYLMGVGTPKDMLDAVEQGVDMFDCVMPTRNARNAMAFTSAGPVRMRRSENRTSDAPLDADCACYTCKTFSRGYLHHLLHANEMLGATLLTLHNVQFYCTLLRFAREAILENRFKAFKASVLEPYTSTEEISK